MKIKIGLIIAFFGMGPSFLWSIDESGGHSLREIRAMQRELSKKHDQYLKNFFDSIKDRSEDEINEFIKKHPLLCAALELEHLKSQATYNARHAVFQSFKGYTLEQKKWVVARTEAFMLREANGWPGFEEQYSEPVKKNKRLHDKIPQKYAFVLSVVKARRIYENFRKEVLDYRADFFAHWMEHFPKPDKELEEKLKVELGKEMLDGLASFEKEIKRVESDSKSIIMNVDEETFQRAREQDCHDYGNLLVETRLGIRRGLKDVTENKHIPRKEKDAYSRQVKKGLDEIDQELHDVSDGKCKKFASEKLEDGQIAFVYKNMPRPMQNLIQPRNGKSRFETEFKKIEEAKRAYAAKQAAESASTNVQTEVLGK